MAVSINVSQNKWVPISQLKGGSASVSVDAAAAASQILSKSCHTSKKGGLLRAVLGQWPAVQPETLGIVF